MGQQENLTEENVEALKAHLEEMKLDNPELRYRFFEQNKPEKEETSPDSKDLTTYIKDLSAKIDMIFGDHVLIDGEFVDITKKINISV